MPAALDGDYVHVTWRMWADDITLLKEFHGRNVNAVVREIVHIYCNRLAADAPHPGNGPKLPYIQIDFG